MLNRACRYRKWLTMQFSPSLRQLYATIKHLVLRFIRLVRLFKRQIHIEDDKSAVNCNASAQKDYPNITVRISGVPCHKVTTIQASGLNWVVIILNLHWFITICIVSIHGGGGKQMTVRQLITTVVELTWFQYLSVDTCSISLLDPSLPSALNNKSLTGTACKD